MEEIRESARQTFLERQDDEMLLMQGNETFNQTKILSPEMRAARLQKEQEAQARVKDYMKEIIICLETVGYLNPFNKVYNLTKDLDYFPLVTALFTINILSQLSYDPQIYSLVKKNKELVVDGPHFIVGIITLFKQYHPSHYRKYISYLAHYVKNMIYSAAS
mmetsp:Transcript_36878/g.35605  ORF Transcript_36878/g.35605 Transcript_36878/m.35605 type:complete len:162 (+) Transcript_36878:3107-3592(+)